MQTYVHIQLHEPDHESKTHEIRILTLYHGQPGDDIYISIAVQTVQEGSHVSEADHWEALSYTWGDKSQPRRDIYVITTETQTTIFEVRENLHHALQQLRKPDNDRRLWIDAICIDQSDTEAARKEKSWQLPIMHEIYGGAVSTIIWLGQACDDSDFGMAFLEELGQTFVFDHVTYRAMMNEARATQRMTDLQNNPDGMSWNSLEHRSVFALFARDWFTRVWIRQEIFAASNSSYILCGSSSLQLIDFRNAVQYLAVRGVDVRSPNHASDLAHLTLALTVCQKDFASIYTIMDRIRIGKCSVPQDKIYGCLGMIKLALGSKFVSKIPTNYPPTLDLFQEFFLLYFEQYKTIRLLRDAGLCQRSTLGGPSWVPDWLTDFARLDLSVECAASHGMLAEAEYIEPDILGVKACFATKVTRVDSLQPVKNLSSDNFGAAYAELSRLMRTHLRPHDKTQMHAFVRALCCPLKALRVPLEQLEDRLEDMEKLAQEVMSSDSENFSEDNYQSIQLLHSDSLAYFQSCIRHFISQNLPFIFTESGHVGIGSDQVQPSDLVFSILGSTNLFLLRPTPNRHIQTPNSHHYQLIGSCYLHNYNWGEALLGPLPEGITVIPRLNAERGTYHPYYKNALTGQASFWDPRIDWSVLTPKTGEAAYTINHAPVGEGEGRRKVPTAEYFVKMHGARVEDVFLV